MVFSGVAARDDFTEFKAKLQGLPNHFMPIISNTHLSNSI
jgi:hypothetical protein